MKNPLNYIYYIQGKFKDAIEFLITGEKDDAHVLRKHIICFGTFN
jgi:hypothetical protein